jgi:hypothetical protein
VAEAISPRVWWGGWVELIGGDAGVGAFDLDVGFAVWSFAEGADDGDG